jgi:hypothetical protein
MVVGLDQLHGERGGTIDRAGRERSAGNGTTINITYHLIAACRVDARARIVRMPIQSKAVSEP